MEQAKKEMLVAAQRFVPQQELSPDPHVLNFAKFGHLVIPSLWVGPHPAPDVGPEQTDPFSSYTGCSRSPFRRCVNLIHETHRYVQALTWAYQNVQKAFIRTTPALQRYRLLMMLYDEFE